MFDFYFDLWSQRYRHRLDFNILDKCILILSVTFTVLSYSLVNLFKVKKTVHRRDSQRHLISSFLLKLFLRQNGRQSFDIAITRIPRYETENCYLFKQRKVFHWLFVKKYFSYWLIQIVRKWKHYQFFNILVSGKNVTMTFLVCLQMVA